MRALRRRPRIAFLCQSPGVAPFTFEKWHAWRGMAEAIRARGGDLLYVAGGDFERDSQAHLYRLLSDRHIDGLIAWQAFVYPQCTDAAIHAFLDRYSSLPFVSMERAIAGHPCVLLDTRQGMQALLAHLVDFHGYRKIVCLAHGARSAQRRRWVFEALMRERGLLDRDLVAPDLDTLDRRGLQPGRDYEAVVAPVDGIAIDTAAALSARGLRVPGDVAVTGFNDGCQASIAPLSLTTVRLPFSTMGRRAAVLVLDLVEGQAVPDEVYVPMELIVRESCGCEDPVVIEAAAGLVRTVSPGLAAAEAELRPRLAREMAQAVQGFEGEGKPHVERLLNAFADTVAAGTGSPSPARAAEAFRAELREALRQTRAADVDATEWHRAISLMRRELLPYLAPAERLRSEDLWQQARFLVGDAVASALRHERWQADQEAQILDEIEQRLLVTFDFDELLETLAEGLPRLGIEAFSLNLYSDPAHPEDGARLMLAQCDGERMTLPEGGVRYATRSLMPEGFSLGDLGNHLILMALQFGEEPLGYMILELDSSRDTRRGGIFEALSGQVGSTLKAVALRREVQAARQRAEEGWRLAEDRRELAEAANTLKSRFLSMVSHELRTPLNLIVSLSEMALWVQPSGSEPDPEALVAALRGYHEQINVTAQHLDRLIRDVLDLASSQVGQLRLIRMSVDLKTLLREVGVMGRQMAQEKGLVWRSEVAQDLPIIEGDRTRLQQVLLNLINNAVKYTSHGEVELSAEIAGADVLISVRDTGLGIVTDEGDRIFDEFRQTERTATRGYGGMGLGLAITRQLVELHGGEIWVESTGVEGEGSTFYFTLPAAPVGSIESLPLPRERSGALVLVTEVRAHPSMLAGHLARQDFDVEMVCVAAGGQDVLNRILRARPGAVVLDMDATSDQGWEIVRMLKAHPSMQDIPVFFHSLGSEQERDAVLELDYPDKPVGAADLARMLSRRGLLKDAAGEHGIEHTILVVDDEPRLCSVYAQMIQAQLPHCRVYTACDGRQALDLIRQLIPDLVLLDLMMPEMDGFDVLKAMREGGTTRHIPVVILTARHLTQEDAMRLDQGVSAVLSKGVFTRAEVIAHVRQALSRGPESSAEAQRCVRQAIAFVHTHYAEPITRGDIAQHLAISDRHLARCCSEILGISPMIYLSRYRIEQAKTMLASGRAQVTDVARAVGFSSQSYFSRVFAREVGISPSAYQRGDR